MTEWVNEYKEHKWVSEDGRARVTAADPNNYVPGLYASRRNPQTKATGFFRLRAYVVRRPSIAWRVLWIGRVRMNRYYQFPPFSWPGRKFFSVVQMEAIDNHE